jgi:hypothetical protein
MRLIAFCEAQADFRIARDLVDRVLREAGPTWLSNLMDTPEDLRVYEVDGEGRPFFDLHRLDRYADDLSVRVPHGHFDGRPGAAGALMARTVFWIVRALMKGGNDITAVIIVWDMDDQPGPRREGLHQARTEAESWASFRIVLGCPNPKREAWVLVGFEPCADDEVARVAALRKELGFAPNVDSHRLTAKDQQAKRSAKRVLDLLTLEDAAREELCWTETPLELLRSRGEQNGLRDFLLEVEERLVPLCRQP